MWTPRYKIYWTATVIDRVHQYYEAMGNTCPMFLPHLGKLAQLCWACCGCFCTWLLFLKHLIIIRNNTTIKNVKKWAGAGDIQSGQDPSKFGFCTWHTWLRRKLVTAREDWWGTPRAVLSISSRYYVKYLAIRFGINSDFSDYTHPISLFNIQSFPVLILHVISLPWLSPPPHPHPLSFFTQLYWLGSDGFAGKYPMPHSCRA